MTLTDEQLNAEIAKLCGMDDRWHIMKRGMYYRPQAAGYTYHTSEAWVVDGVEAKTHEYKHPGAGDEWVTIHKAPPPLFSSSLDAMHLAELTLDRSTRVEVAGIGMFSSEFSHYTCRIMSYGSPFDQFQYPPLGPSEQDLERLILASPRTRAECFYVVKSKATP